MPGPLALSGLVTARALRPWFTALAPLALGVLLSGCAGGSPKPTSVPAEQAAKPVEEKVPPGPEDLALLERLERLYAAGEYPGREAINWVRGGWVRNHYLALKGERPYTAAQFAQARKVITPVVERGEYALTWPKPIGFTIPRTRTPPTIDGQGDDPVWRQAVVFDQEFRFNHLEPLEESRATWRLLWDERHLYALVTVRDTHIIAPELPRDGAVFGADCIELFILPEFRTGAYWEIVVGPTGTLFDALHGKRWEDWGSDMRVNQDVAGLRLATSIRGTPNNNDDVDEGYTVELAIPFAALPEYSRARPTVGHTLHLTLVHLDKHPDGKMDTLAFQPLMSWGHNIWSHCTATLGPLAD